MPRAQPHHMKECYLHTNHDLLFHHKRAHPPSSTHKFTSTHIILRNTFCWVTLCLLLLVFVSCYPFIALHSVDFFYLNAFTLSGIMIAHIRTMLLHAWQLQWRGWLTIWIELMCLISYLQLSFSISLLTFSLLPFLLIFSHTKSFFCCWFFTIAISNETRSEKYLTKLLSYTSFVSNWVTFFCFSAAFWALLHYQ